MFAGRYQLERRLGAGGMAEVWEATLRGEAGFTRRVAIKRLFPESGRDEQFVRRFLDEARIASRLHHANIVGILDFGVEESGPYQVLEFIDGFDLGYLARLGRDAGRALPTGLALFVCATAGHALHFAHTATDDDGKPMNVVHRDVSPQNILVSRGGDVKLSDFGIAIAEGRLEKTMGGATPGKPAYMAPEQAIRGALDARTDVFALGCVLHALVTGRSPLADENALVDLLAGTELALDAQLAPEVREVIALAVRRNKAERYESAEAFALAAGALVPRLLAADPRVALRDWVVSVAPAKELTLSPVVATPVIATPRIPPSRVRSRTVVLLVGLAGLGLAGSFVVQRTSSSPVELPVADAPDASVRVEPLTSIVTQDAGVPVPAVAPKPPERRVAAPTRPAPKPIVTQTGVLAIGGESFLRGEVLVDGESRGFAPRRFEVLVGEHTVEVVAPSGARFGPRRVTITPRHTALSPLSWVE